MNIKITDQILDEVINAHPSRGNREGVTNGNTGLDPTCLEKTIFGIASCRYWMEDET